METKTCTFCSEVRPVDDFARNCNSRDGRRHQCKTCIRRAHPPRRTLRGDLRPYGLSVVEYRLLQLAQEDRCAICGEPETQTYRGQVKRLAVDHDHDTGEVRGLLCSQCNRALGMFNDDAGRLRSAVEYLGGFV